MSFDQYPEANSSSAIPDGGTVDLLRRRHPASGGVHWFSRGIGIGTTLYIGVFGLHNSPGQVSTNTGADNGIPGNHSGFSTYGAEVTSRKNKNDSGLSPEKLKVSARMLSCLLGKINATAQVIPPAPLFLRHLQMTLTEPLNKGGQDYETEISLSQECIEELLWWDNHMNQWNGKSVVKRYINTVIESDASLTGQHAHNNGPGVLGPDKRLGCR